MSGERARAITIRCGERDIAAFVFETPQFHYVAIWCDDPDVLVCAPSEPGAIEKFRAQVARMEEAQ